MAVCSSKSALYCSPLLVPTLSPTHLLLIMVAAWIRSNSTLVVVIKLFLKNTDNIERLQTVRVVSVSQHSLDSSNKLLTYSFSRFNPTPTPISSVQKMKRGSEVG